MEAIKAAGYKPGEDITLALDAAASEFSVDGGKDGEMIYHFQREGGHKRTTAEMVDWYAVFAKSTQSLLLKMDSTKMTGLVLQCFVSVLVTRSNRW